MSDTPVLGLNAYEHIRYLVKSIGPRPAGSSAEKLGLDYAAEQFIRFGYTPEWIPVPFGPTPKLYFQNLVAGGVLIISSWLWQSAPILTLLTPLFMLVLPEMEKLEIGLRRHDHRSYDVAAFNDGPADAPMVVFCAHIDSAPAMAVDHPFSVRLFANGMRILQRLAILIALLSLAWLLGFQVPFSIYWPIGILGSLAGGWFMLVDLINQLDHRKGNSPGAVDNASGVGMVLSLAEAFAESQPKRLRLGYLITGAEEPGLFGAEAFVKRLKQVKGKTVVFNLDMVGAGENIQVVTRSGSLLVRDTSHQLNGLLFEIQPEAKPVWYSLKSSDFLPFLRAGLETVSIQTTGSDEAEVAYHTRKDNFNLIDIRSLEITGDLINRFIEILPYSDWALNQAGLQK